MNPNKLFPLVVTDKLAETKAFYTEQAGFTVTVDHDDFYLQVRHGDDESAPELCFMRRQSDGPMSGIDAFEGRGLIVSIPTSSADTKHEQLVQRGAPILAEPSDKPWGWRSFLVADPNGIVLDFFHVRADSSVADAAS